MTRLIGGLALGVALVVGVAVPAAAQTTWRLHSQFNEARPEARWLDELAAKVKERTNGQLIIQPFHGGSLGLRDADLLRTLRAGAAEMAITIVETQGRDAPEVAFIYNTGMIKDDKDHFRVEPVLQEIYREVFEGRGLVVAGTLQPTLFPLHIMCRDRPVNSLAALRGLKLRVFSRTLGDTFGAFGVAAQIVPQNEMYVAMQTGVIDCAVYGYNSARTISLNEVARYGAYFGTYAAAPYPVLVNRSAWDRAGPQLQRAVTEALAEMSEKTRALATDTSLEDQAQAEFRAKGFTVLEPFPTADQVALQRASFEVANRIAKDYGAAVEANLKRVLAGLGL